MERKYELDRELDGYISLVRKRTKGSALNKLLRKKRKKAAEEPVQIEKYPFVSKKGATGAGRGSFIKSWSNGFLRLFKRAEPIEPPEMPEPEEVKETVINDAEFEKEMGELKDDKKEKSPGVWGLFSRLNFLKRPGRLPGYDAPGKEDLEGLSGERVTKVVLERPEVEKDIKKIALVTQSILQGLPDEELKKFRESDDFLIYKDVLEKYDLIKKKE